MVDLHASHALAKLEGGERETKTTFLLTRPLSSLITPLKAKTPYTYLSRVGTSIFFALYLHAHLYNLCHNASYEQNFVGSVRQYNISV